MIAVTCWFSFHFSWHFFGKVRWKVLAGSPSCRTPDPGSCGSLWSCQPLVKHFKQCGSNGTRLVKFNFATCPDQWQGTKRIPTAVRRNEVMHSHSESYSHSHSLLFSSLPSVFFFFFWRGRQFVKWIPSHFGKLHKQEKQALALAPSLSPRLTWHLEWPGESPECSSSSQGKIF